MPQTNKLIKSVHGIELSSNEDGSEAYLTLKKEDLPEGSPTVEELRGILTESGITFGTIEDAVTQLTTNPSYSQPVLIAKGKQAVAGEDARIEFLFDINPSHEPTVDARGNIDYKDQHFIQNAQSGRILVKKHCATPESPGRSVFDTEIPAKPGRDRDLPVGVNVEKSEDGLTLTAMIDGTICYLGGKVNVLPDQNLSGSVDSSTGNVDCAGSLHIGKDVTSDFKVRSGRDLEIGGNVEDAKIIAGGSILIRGGFFGRGKGSLVAGADVTVKYVENQKIRSGGSIFIGNEVHNCDLYAADSIIVKDRNGSIAGGKCAARNFIRACKLGNDASVPTHIYVAYDMETVERQRQITHELEKLAENEHNVKEAMVKLYQLEMAGRLPPDQKLTLDKFKRLANEIPDRRRELESEYGRLEATVENLQGARIVADDVVHPGTTLHFGALYKTIIEEITGPVYFERCDDGVVESALTRELEQAWENERQERRKQRLPLPDSSLPESESSLEHAPPVASV